MCKKLVFLMSVVLVLGLVGSVVATDNPGRGAFIILISDSPDGELERLEPFLKKIYGEGVSIEGVDDKYIELDAAKIATLQSASLIIISDASDDDEFCDGPGELEFWNGLEIPIFLAANDHGSSESDPNYMWRWFDADGENEDWPVGDYYLDVNDVCDPIWDGIDTTTDPCRVWFIYADPEKTPELPECNSAGYGTLLALADVGGSEPNLILARWAPGTQFWDDPCNPQTAGGPRIFFAMESFSKEIVSLTPDGEKLLENIMTELLWYTFDPNIAYGPYPKPGEPKAPVDAVLHWTPGDNVGSGGGLNGHMLYFHTNWAYVNERNVAQAAQAPYFTDVNEWDPFDSAYLEYGQTYYWCVDEFNSGHPDGGYPDTLWRSPVWSFTAAKSISGEDWEDYLTGAAMREYWEEVGDIILNLETGIVHGGAQAMCANTYLDVGEATLTCIPAMSLAESIKAMGVWFYGDEENVPAETQLYLKIEDGTGDSNTVYYDGEMSDLADANWHQWAIDLADFRDAVPAVDLMDVKYLILGFGNTGEESSTMYFDDIEFFEWMCLVSSPGDFTGPGDFNDCLVDTWDLMAFTDVWLEHEYYIYAVPPTDPCVAYWNLEEGPGYDTLADGTGNGNTGKFHVDDDYLGEYDPTNDPCWVAGKMGTWALHFDGNDFIRVDDRDGAGEVNCGTGPFTIGLWMNYDDDIYYPDKVYLLCKGTSSSSDWLDELGAPIGAGKSYDIELHPGGAEGKSELGIKLDDDVDKTSFGSVDLDMDPNVWYHVALQRDWGAAKVRIYLNAELVGEDVDDSQTASICAPGEPLFIGLKKKVSYEANRFRGKLDDIFLCTSALSAEELLSVMGLSEKFIPLRHPEFNPVEDWIINFEDAAIIADNWGANTRFPEFKE